MSQQQKPPPVPPASVAAVPGSRLEELLAGYETAKAAAEDAADRFDALTKAIKNELAASSNGSTDIVLSGAPGLPRLRMKWLRPYRFDSKRFRAEHPQLYVRYEVQGGHWELRQES